MTKLRGHSHGQCPVLPEVEVVRSQPCQGAGVDGLVPPHTEAHCMPLNLGVYLSQ